MAAPIRMTLEGDKAMKRKLEGIAREMPLAARRGTRVVAEQKLAMAQDRAPEKTGRLKRSGRIRVSVRKKEGKENISATIVFGGAELGVLYARKVHETHPTHSKFLESVLMESVSTMGGDLAREIDLKRIAMEAR